MPIWSCRCGPAASVVPRYESSATAGDQFPLTKNILSHSSKRLPPLKNINIYLSTQGGLSISNPPQPPACFFVAVPVSIALCQLSNHLIFFFFFALHNKYAFSVETTSFKLQKSSCIPPAGLQSKVYIFGPRGRTLPFGELDQIWGLKTWGGFETAARVHRHWMAEWFGSVCTNVDNSAKRILKIVH